MQSCVVTCSHVQSRAVTCSVAKDVECVRYPNLTKNTIKSNVAQFFLAHLLVLLAGCPCFYLGGLVGLTVGLAIGGIVSIAGKVVVGLSIWSL